jgi:hypothetical protein
MASCMRDRVIRCFPQAADLHQLADLVRELAPRRALLALPQRERRQVIFSASIIPC